jgi:uroporphyrinogen decarboxylase
MTEQDKPLFLRALAGEDTPYAPVWFMRQAGRFLPEYRALKERHSFWALARTPELAAEVTMQPVRRLGVDAAILFQDIMTPLPPMGIDIDFTPGPVIADPIRSMAQVDALRVPEADEIAPFVGEAIRLIRGECPVPLIGFGGAPLTLATYLVEGKGAKDYSELRVFLRTQPEAAHALLDKLTEVSIRYLRAQVEAGAQAIQLFDSWAGLHDAATWSTFAAPYNQRVLDAITVPRIYLAVGASHLLPMFGDVRCEAFSVDWRTPLQQVRTFTGTRALQGNLDPAVLCAPLSIVEPEVRRVLADGRGGAHVFNLGHGMLPSADPDTVKRVVELVHGTPRYADR